MVEPGLFIFNYSPKPEVLELGPWPYNDKSLFLQPRSSTKIYGHNNLCNSSMVSIAEAQASSWNGSILRKIASVIGKPLFTDSITADRGRLAYARICVGVSNFHKKNSFPLSKEHLLSINDSKWVRQTTRKSRRLWSITFEMASTGLRNLFSLVYLSTSFLPWIHL